MKPAGLSPGARRGRRPDRPFLIVAGWLLGVAEPRLVPSRPFGPRSGAGTTARCRDSRGRSGCPLLRLSRLPETCWGAGHPIEDAPDLVMCTPPATLRFAGLGCLDLYGAFDELKRAAMGTRRWSRARSRGTRGASARGTPVLCLCTLAEHEDLASDHPRTRAAEGTSRLG